MHNLKQNMNRMTGALGKSFHQFEIYKMYKIDCYAQLRTKNTTILQILI